MDFFDNIVMLVGCLLIVVGVVMFAIGKKESANQNNVEGFGIKVNVSNPSIILIVLGIGLLLVPRLLPSDASVGASSADKHAVGLPKPAQPDFSGNSEITKADDPYDDLGNDELNGRDEGDSGYLPDQDNSNEQEFEPEAEPVFEPKRKNQPQTYFPGGLWQLSDYAENGIDLTDNVNGSIEFSQRSSNSAQWVTDFVIVDGWGNMARYQYQGSMSYRNGSYFITIVNSTDPNFTGQQSAPMELKIDSDSRLHMGYRINNMDILIHWLEN
ncbi:hypothetical protein [Thalassotalea montiporae]